jgi:two-component system chemotaxis sensor kinase CheA
MHLFRNAVDHGIEMPEERLQKGKPEQGRIRLDAELLPEGLKLIIGDDGRGLALSKLRQKGIEKGLIQPDESDPQKIAELIFASGFSTATTVTEVSGRGVGMDAVRCFLEEKGGSIHIQLDDAVTVETPWCRFVTEVLVPQTSNLQGSPDRHLTAAFR